jgi:DNA-binding response OmpR family regulator
MGSTVNAGRAWRFGVFEVEASSGELRRSGTLVRLREQPTRILIHLLEHAGRIVTREALRQQLWPSDTYVDFDHSLNTAVMRLREALGDSADNLSTSKLCRRKAIVSSRQSPGLAACRTVLRSIHRRLPRCVLTMRSA